MDTQESFYVVFVYSLHRVIDRRELWRGLRRLDYDIPCLFIEDFNAIYREDHRKNGSQVTSYEIYDMQKWMEDLDLHPINKQGHKYS